MTTAWLPAARWSRVTTPWSAAGRASTNRSGPPRRGGAGRVVRPPARVRAAASARSGGRCDTMASANPPAAVPARDRGAADEAVSPAPESAALAGPGHAARARAPQPEEAEDGQDERHEAVAAAEAGPHRVAGEELGHEEAERADDEHADHLDGHRGPCQTPHAPAVVRQPDRREDVDQGREPRQPVGERGLAGVPEQLDARP